MTQMFHTIGKLETQAKFLQKAKEDGSCISHQLFKNNGIAYACHNGGYHLLPMGMKAFEKLTRIVDEEMELVGGEKVSLTTLAPRELWEATGRWDSTGKELFTLQDRAKKDYCLGPTHEEVITDLISKKKMMSHKFLPIRLYQISRKFRDEQKPNRGLFRGREFEMKDMYSFDANEEKALESYRAVCTAYERLFNRIGVPWVKVKGTSGTIGGDLSHEFSYLTDQGSDKLIICDNCGIHINKEVSNEQVIHKQGCPHEGSPIKEVKAIEVGHAFYLGQKYSSPMDACYITETSKQQHYSMGCYGLGLTRILQAGVEVLSGDQAIRWPRLLAPYQVCIIPKKDLNAAAYLALAESVSDALTQRPNLRREVVIDNRIKETIGRRQQEADRMGYPYIVIVGKKALEESLFELIDINKGETTFLSLDQLCDQLGNVETV